ncbi:MAG: DUF2862 domain-containing protein [Prochlorococcaceae cyanobacterium ETNP1_MAG_9]|jgi:hypothetical protein|nr:DUF2862 domain-containing protein [Prochlorococcaceae cyanobacterium ETNP1_MAG_9]
MSKESTLTRIGASVRVQIDQVRDRIPKGLLTKLKDNPRGKVVDYKMTDGTDIGLVLELSDGTTSWFFNEEIARG